MTSYKLWFTSTAVLLLFALQWLLWQGKGGIGDVKRLKIAIVQVEKELEALSLRNLALDQEVRQLKRNPLLIEERARLELGLIKPGESYLAMPD
ncbi:MAG: septum formation initiator family protein [Gammaproteobacteria bacterium]